MLAITTVASVPLAYAPAPALLSYSDFQIWTFSLVWDGYTVTRINHDDLGDMNYETYSNPRSNGGGVLGRYYRGHQITIEVTITWDTPAELQNRMDDMKRGIAGLEDYLYIRTPVDQRRIKGTVVSIDFGREHYHVTFVRAKITFRTVKPFMEAITWESLSRIWDTASFLDEFLHLGTAETLPKIYMVFSSASVSSLTITVSGVAFNVLEVITSWDLLIIDSEEKTATINGLVVDYSGIFPTFTPGANSISVTFVWTCTVDTTIVSAKTYL